MILDNIEYIQTGFENPAAAATAMLISYYRPELVKFYYEQLASTFESEEFYNWIKENYSIHDIQIDFLVYLCMEFLIRKHDKSLNPQIIKTDLDKIIYTFTKRRIPVIMKMNNSVILIKGYTEKYLICNDPNGNMNSNYIDKYGENVVYSIENIANTLNSNSIYVFTLRTDLTEKT